LETGFGASNTKPGREAIPFGVVTLMLPVAPVPTTAVILVADTTVKEDAEAPPKLTTVVPVKFVPVMVTVTPCVAVFGVNDVMVAVVLTIGLDFSFLQENRKTEIVNSLKTNFILDFINYQNYTLN
jgi:hypothetical protein